MEPARAAGFGGRGLVGGGMYPGGGLDAPGGPVDDAMDVKDTVLPCCEAAQGRKGPSSGAVIRMRGRRS